MTVTIQPGLFEAPEAPAPVCCAQAVRDRIRVSAVSTEHNFFITEWYSLLRRFVGAAMCKTGPAQAGQALLF